MPVLEILTYPHPILQKVCEPVKEVDERVLAFIKDLVDTMKAVQHASGIAAPQVGVPLRVVAVDVTPRRPGRGLTVLLNPEIISSKGAKSAREGCLSVPEYTANIVRAEEITLKGLDENGRAVVIESTGFEAVAFQHEIDHLDGILFIDRIQNMKRDLFRRKPRQE